MKKIIFAIALCLQSFGAELLVLHTNDSHGHVLSNKQKIDANTSLMIGGLSTRASLIKQIRQGHKNVLILDAGDINTGGALSNALHAKPDILAYNAMGYDAVTIGNHEFDNNTSLLKDQIKLSKFSWLSANVTQNGKFIAKPYIIKDFGEFKVGIFGLTTCTSKESAMLEKDIFIQNELDAAKTAIAELKAKGVDIIIALTHLGDVKDKANQFTSIDLANSLNGVDLIIDGHSHSYFSSPKIINNTPIVTAKCFGAYLGVARMQIKDKKVHDFKWESILVDDKLYPKDSQIQGIIEPLKQDFQKDLNQVIFTAASDFGDDIKAARKGQSPNGDLVADAIKFAAKKIDKDTDFAITNGGGVRENFDKGEVKKADIMKVLPFKNQVMIVKMRGDDLLKLLSQVHNLGSGGFLQVSDGISYTLHYDKYGKNGLISDIKINDVLLEKQRVYTFGTNDFTFKGGDGYKFSGVLSAKNTKISVFDALIEYVKNLKQPISPNKKKRIRLEFDIKFD
ncbi:MAG: bifunctional metallophosphatase/5'-nucleotidase [Campylobacter sp.]|nr:bifunctional metallophosphatase/5'-nucleotidase [Campylobacter sp.]